MTEGEKLLIDDANDFVRYTSNLQENLAQGTGIGPEPDVETTETVAPPQKIGLGIIEETEDKTPESE